MLAPIVAIADVNRSLPANVRVVDVLERGGQGTVYRGAVDGVAAAIKLYTTHPYELRVDRGIDALLRVTSRTIVRLLWSGAVSFGSEPVRIVATQLIAGAPLDKVLGQRALTPDEVGAVIVDVAEAVEALWEKRIVHRDLKPSNVILDGGRATVIDLGIARHVDQASLTATGSTWGTRGYMSPEQCRNVKQLTCKSDLYALGVIAVQCCTQVHPTGGDQQRLLTAGLSSGLPKKAAALPFAALVARLLEHRPTRRPLPADVLRELARFAR